MEPGPGMFGATPPLTLPPNLIEGQRSGQWPRVRREFLETHDECAACGRTGDLEVHHIIPVHVALAMGKPELELDPANLIALCGNPCHFVHGHLMGWARTNEDVVEDCRRYREKVAAARRITGEMPDSPPESP